MNSNRGQYNASPLYNLKNRRPDRKKEEEQLPESAPDTERRYPLLSLLLSILLPALFLVCLLVPSTPLRWVFLGLTGLSVLVMWLLRAFVRSARNTLTVIYAALAAVIVLSMVINQTPESRRASASAQTQTSLYSDQDRGSFTAVPGETPAPTPEAETEESDPAIPEAQARLEAFFQVWERNSVTEMKEYCWPAWVNEQPSAETELFQMLRRSKPVDYTVEETASSADGTNSRIITVKATFDENGEYSVKRMRVIMRRVNDVWYIDPNSLDGVNVDEEAEAAAAAQYQMIASTIAPTDVPSEKTGVTVYYNVHGGKYYHLDPRCSAVDSSYWPLTGVIPFELINSKEYSKLIPCSKCGAPARPDVN